MLEILLNFFGDALLVHDWQLVSDRARAFFRVLFGVVGGVLCLGGGYVFVVEQSAEGMTVFTAAYAVLFLALAAFFFCIALGRGIRWAGWGVGASVVGLFLARIVFGA